MTAQQLMGPASEGNYPAGWYPSHVKPGFEHWWDGTRWTGAERATGTIPGFAPQPVQAVTVNVEAGRGIGGWHAAHFVMSCLTFGLWIPVWIIHAIAGKGRR